MLERNITCQFPTEAVTGRRIAHCQLAARERAILAAELVLGRRQLVHPTISQTGNLLQVSVTHVRNALTILNDDAGRQERALQECIFGPLPLATAAEQVRRRKRTPQLSSLPRAWACATAKERLEAVRLIGVNQIWDIIEQIV
jgi:hypothetical protein